MTKSLITILFIIAAVVLFWFWTKPNLDAIDKLRAETTAVNKALEDATELQKLRDRLLEDYNLISQDDLLRLSKFLPRDPEVPKLTVELENISKTTGVVIKNFNATRVVENTRAPLTVGGVESLPVAPKAEQIFLDVAVSAAYDGFVAFLEELQKSLRLMDVHLISFSAGEKNFYEFNIKATTYWLK
jgi:Tfp pilus assembly protein PilO